MNSKQQKQHYPHSDSPKTHPADEPRRSDAAQSVTTNPRDSGAGGGSTPLGEHGQDSRTWTVGPVNGGKVPEPTVHAAATHATSGRIAKDGTPHAGEKQGSEHQDTPATLSPDQPHAKRDTL
jgi:hypothetical protein